MIVASWNVNSISVRLPQVMDWLETNKPDVLCIQETKATDDKFSKESFETAGYHCEFFGEKTYNGVAIISRLPQEKVQKGFKGDTPLASRRFIEAKIGPVYVSNVYVPNGSAVGSDKFLYKLNWMKMLTEHLIANHKSQEMLVLCGDFNVAPEEKDVYDPEAFKDQILFTPDEREALQSVKQWGFIDTFRLHNKDAGQYSWWDYRSAAFRRNMGLRIDHIWATEPLAYKCSRAWIDKAPRKDDRPSDHAPVAAEFKLP